MNHLDFFEATILNNGATYNPLTNRLNYIKGYLVSLPHFEQRIEKHNFSVQHVKDYIKSNLGTLNENLFIGSWINDDVVYLDISECILDKRIAIERAYRHNQSALYDANNNVVINLPTPQRSGTETQKQAYITSVVDRLC